MTDHPLDQETVAALWDTYPNLNRWDDWRPAAHADLVSAFRLVCDVGRWQERNTTPEDDRHWEPLNRRPARVGDKVRQELSGITTTAVVGRVDKDGDPWTLEGKFIGEINRGTWYRRAALNGETR